MKPKNTLLASALLTTAALSAHVTIELTPEQATVLKPYDHVVVAGQFNAIGDAVQAVSHKADRNGAASFYAVDTSGYGNGGSWRVTTNLCEDNAPRTDAPKNRIINGAAELPRDQAATLIPYNTVTIQGLYHSQPEVNDTITEAAKVKGTYAFFIVRQMDANQGGNQHITVYICKKDVEKCVLQSPNAIPADSDASHAALVKGGEAAKNVEIPGVITTAAVDPGTGVSRFFETQSSKGGHYTVALPDGTKMKEVNKVTAAQMAPFDNIQFTGNYGNMTEISYQAAERAAKKGARHYHITRQRQEHGSNITIGADLYK